MGEFDEFEALSFDCYGTLIDWETGITSELRRWADRRGLETPDETLLELYSAIETGVQAAEQPALPYPEVLAETLREIGRQFATTVDESDASSFGASVRAWPAFADSPAALARLATRFKLIVVSNIDRASFSFSQARLGVEFDRVITAEEVGSYKPAAPHFDALLGSLDDLGVERHALLHVAQSIYHDHEPARRFGLQSVWIDRRAGKDGWGATPAPQTGEAAPRWRFPTMEAFAQAAVPETD